MVTDAPVAQRKFKGRTYYSQDILKLKLPKIYQGHVFPVELLDTAQFYGLPHHTVKLDVGTIIIIIKDIEVLVVNSDAIMTARMATMGTVFSVMPEGLFEGYIKVRRVDGENMDETVHIGREIFYTCSNSLRFELLRKQFPVRVL